MDTSKIIKGVVNSGRYTVTAPIVKEDYGLYLQIEGVELPSTYEVDFSNSENNGTSVTMIGNSDGVLIPHQFIDTGKDIFAFLYHVGANYGRTVYKFRIPNKVRPDRTNEEPTPEEQSVIDQAINALNEAVAQTAEDVIDASASASQASTSATASAQSASQSAQIKSDIEGMVDDAQGYAQASAQSASASANSASQAQGFAQSASASANSASGYASQADISANTASNKASEASTSASTASAKATESAQSASQALSYKTDAESAKTASQTAQGLAESARDTAVQAKEDAESARDEAQSAVASISGALDDKAPVITDTASGAIASFTDGADGLPLKSLVVSIDPVQDTSSGDSSPENICHISGWTGCEVDASGKNLFDEANATIYKRYFRITPGGYAWGTSPDSSSYVFKCLPNTTYTLKPNNSDVTIFRVATINVSIEESENVTLNQVSTTSNPRTITTDSDATYIVIQESNIIASKRATQLQIELGDSATEYESFKGVFIPINWQTEAGTVYGGKLDVLSGVLTVYPYYASYNGETLTGEWISDRDKYVSGTTPTIGAQVVNIGAQGVTVQLEPHEVESLYGVNNLWADSGDTEVEYRADTKAWIQRKIAEAIASLT